MTAQAQGSTDHVTEAFSAGCEYVRMFSGLDVHGPPPPNQRGNWLQCTLKDTSSVLPKMLMLDNPVTISKTSALSAKSRNSEDP